MRRLIIGLGLGGVLLLAACGGGTTPTPQEPAISGTFASFTGTVNYLGLALLIADGAALAPSSLSEGRPGVFSTEIVPIGSGGSFNVPLPAGDQLPDRVMANADAFFSSRGVFACTFNASDPTVRVSQVAFGGGMINPGLVAYSAIFSVPGLVTTSPIEGTLEGAEFVTWIYAEQDVEIGTDAAGCTDGSSTLHVNLKLTQGWNYVGITNEPDPADEEASIVHMYEIEAGPIHVLGAET